LQKAELSPAPPLELPPEPEPDPLEAPPDDAAPEDVAPPPLETEPPLEGLEAPEALPPPEVADEATPVDAVARAVPGGAEAGAATLALLVVWAVVEAGAPVVELPVGTVSRGCNTVPVALELPPQAAIPAAQAMPARAAATTRTASPGRITLLTVFPAVPSACRSADSR
jgi:hypothetical protein